MAVNRVINSILREPIVNKKTKRPHDNGEGVTTALANNQEFLEPAELA
jgi:hypothetical protein